MTKPKLSYIICINPRSGSWLLGDGLERTGIAGRPREWFSMEKTGANEEFFSERWGIAPPSVTGNYKEYVEKMYEAASTPNGVFSFRCHQEQFEHIPGKLRTIPEYADVPLHELPAKVFPNLRYVWLTRKDKVRQAISYYRASKSDIWRVENGKNAITPPPIEFDARAIERFEDAFIYKDRFLHEYFTRYNIPPIMVYYEDLSERYEATLRNLMIEIGIEGAKTVNIPPQKYVKLANAQSEEWAERYAEYKVQKPKA